MIDPARLAEFVRAARRASSSTNDLIAAAQVLLRDQLALTAAVEELARDLEADSTSGLDN